MSIRNLLATATLVLILLPNVHAQKIYGTVFQKDGKPLEFATMTLNRANDSVLLQGAISGQDGEYSFIKPKAGKYYISATMIGMNKVKSPIFDYSSGDLQIDSITLEELNTQLSQVTITAKRPAIEIKADKTILNVEGNISATGLNALELLRKAPGVTVDNNDNISVKGKNGVKFQIDGREVPLDSKDMAMQLKSMQASEIGNIEIITNPSARYDASGNAGIINIRMKKNRSYGTNGSAGLEYIQGITPKGGVNLSLNHRDAGYNVYGSYNNHYGRWYNDQFYEREQNGLYFDQGANSYYMSRWNDARIGADWFVNKKSTFGILVNVNTNPNDWISHSRTNISKLAAPTVLDSFLLADNIVKSTRNNNNINLNYTYSDTNGRTISADFNKGYYGLEGNGRMTNTYMAVNGLDTLHSYANHALTPTTIYLTTLKADYEQKLWKGSFSGGIKVSDVLTDNHYNFYDVFAEVEVKNDEISNQFTYKERNAAAYVNYQVQLGKWNLQAGLRAENTDYKGELNTNTAQNNEKIDNNYTKLFPSAALTYMFTDKYGINTTYSRRIDRPSYQDLNPFEFKMDEMTYMKGNPMLQPQFTNSLELSSIIMGHPVLTLGYSHTTDVMAQILDTAGSNASYITTKNLAEQTNYSLAINVPTPIAKWWEGMISITGYMSHIQAEVRSGFDIDKEFSAYNVYVEQMFKLPKGYSVQVSGWYNSPSVQGTLAFEAQGAMDLSMQKKILKDKGEIKLRFGDILNTANWAGKNLYTPGLEMYAYGNYESRTATLNFTYRFGSNEVRTSRQRRTGLEDESQRIKSGRN